MIQNQPFPAPGHSIAEFAEEVAASDGEGGFYFDRPQTTEDMIYHLKHLWVEMLGAGHDLPATVAKFLIEEGICDDSASMTKLREFAAAE